MAANSTIIIFLSATKSLLTEMMGSIVGTVEPTTPYVPTGQSVLDTNYPFAGISTFSPGSTGEKK